MGGYKSPAKVKLVVGMLGENPGILERAREILRIRYGREEEVMAPIPFTWTQYYAEEVGANPFRTFVSYEALMDRENLVEVKRHTNQVESELARAGLRPVNLDPGYLTLGQFFLATTKDQRHRVYVRDGIFVEPTLYFQDGSFHPFAWTYRDYRSEEYLGYFLAARAKLAFQLRGSGRPFSHRTSGSSDLGKGVSASRESGPSDSPRQNQGEGSSNGNPRA